MVMRGLVKIDFQRLSFLGVINSRQLPLAPSDYKNNNSSNDKNTINGYVSLGLDLRICTKEASHSRYHSRDGIGQDVGRWFFTIALVLAVPTEETNDGIHFCHNERVGR